MQKIALSLWVLPNAGESIARSVASKDLFLKLLQAAKTISEASPSIQAAKYRLHILSSFQRLSEAAALLQLSSLLIDDIVAAFYSGDEMAASPSPILLGERQHHLPSGLCRFHTDVSTALESMGVPHAVEFSSPDGLLSIDIVARCGDGKPLAIEVDGEEHFTRLPPYRPLGHTLIRNQMIAAMGFRGVGLPFYDWKSLSSLTEKVTYMTARLAKWGISPS